MLIEVNVDSLVGPTHHFGGLGVGNVASIEHGSQVSHPRQAALEGLEKAWLVASFGVPQYMWLPPLRPRSDMFSHVGFHGGLPSQLRSVAAEAPRLLSAAFSSSFMWTANAATVTPAVDAIDHCGRITPANLISSWHRAVEASERMVDLERLCGNVASLVINEPLPAIVPLRDEGAANHMRLSTIGGEYGIHLFVYGDDENVATPSGRFPARQTRAACAALARLHRLPPDRVYLLPQHPTAIAAGVFHNDVIATSHGNLLLHHQFAYSDSEETLQRMEDNFEVATGEKLIRVMVSDAELPLANAVSSYFFNSQILTPRGSGDQPRMVMLCPKQCQHDPAVQALIHRLLSDPQIPVEQVHYLSLEQSMANGGGPACLRLRLPLPAEQVEQLNPRLLLDARLRERLAEIVQHWYPNQVTLADFVDLEFVAQVLQAVQSLHAVMAE